ncbi:hypothetical protein [Methylobacterium sp. J-076]|uniref:hypothetical protein n=1 Tax=Methylobacterium sp. J-076 TaxID=2836655 RepID=UPI001FBA8A5F|nr:hypothetical protein [Methylobacterium sp. J-076]MCJ2013122.1 hypothetical protein [Methylobacterium sp. J-076]
MASSVGQAGESYLQNQASGATISSTGDDFAKNLAALEEVSREQQRKQIEMRKVAAILGTEQAAAKKEASQ